jgi:hypothetical protein
MRWGWIAILGLAPWAPSAPVSAYLETTQGANLVFWKAGSPATIWNNSSKTLSWSFSSINFPRSNWPSVAQAGAALQNAFQTYEDVPGSSIRFNRLPNTTGRPSSKDGKLEIAFAPNASNDYYGNDISGAYAVTYMLWNGSGALLDADIVFNGDPAEFTWSTGDVPVSTTTADVEVTMLHEGIHAVGGGHPVYFYAAVWPTGRSPEKPLNDRCLSPDDRILLRLLYPETPALGTISGQVNLSSGGGCARAIVVATDAAGIPQATRVTDSSGAYSIRVPAGTYSLTAHHHLNSLYGTSDINFRVAPGFTTATTVSGVGVASGETATAPALTATAGTPKMRLTRITTLPNSPEMQVQFLRRGFAGTIVVRISGVTLSESDISSIDFGPGITVSAWTTTTSTTPRATLVNVPITVDSGATAGPRTLAITRTTGERALWPAAVMILDKASLALSADPANPGPSSAAPGSTDVPLLQVRLQADAVEDVRVRRLEFSIAGIGPTLPDVRLWKVESTNVRVFSGAAYANNPVSETKSATPSGTVVFDNLALSVPAGGTLTLLLTADMPSSGSGNYSASLAASDITAHGMYYGDVITVAGGTVTGGPITLESIGVSNLGQFRATAGTAISVGGYTPETQVEIRGTVTAQSGSVGLEVEVKPVGSGFTGSGTTSSAVNYTSGSEISVTVTGLSNLTEYHWRARALGSTLSPSAWVSFGGNAETQRDFSVDTGTTAPPTALAQAGPGGAPPVPLGGSTPGGIQLSGTNGTNSDGQQVRLEIEVRPAGTLFSNTPTLVTPWGAGGAVTSALFSGPTGDYHWQARTVAFYGSESSWVAFDPAPVHFRLEPVESIEASGGCAGNVAVVGGLFRIAAWLLLGSILAVRVFRRRLPGAPFALLLVLPSVASAADLTDLPRSVSESEPAAVRARADDPWGSFALYLGAAFRDSAFEATGTDSIEREVDGLGAATLGLEALVHLHEDWRIGLAAEAGWGGDLRFAGAGPVLTWTFARSQPKAAGGASDFEHLFKVGVLFQTLEVDKSDFGDFEAALEARVGYELRISMTAGWAATLGLEARYAVWDYDESILSGDDELGGFGVFLSAGIAWTP